MARPRKALAIDVKPRAIEAAMQILREAPDLLSLSAIARAIGVSAPALYAHFTGKDDLLEQVRARALDDMLAAKRAALAGLTGDSLARLRAGGHDYVSFAQANPALYRLIFAPEHDRATHAVSLDAASVAPLTEAVRAAKAEGYLSGAEPAAVAHGLWFAVHGAVMMALDGQLPGTDADRWARAYGAVTTLTDLIATTKPNT